MLRYSQAKFVNVIYQPKKQQCRVTGTYYNGLQRYYRKWFTLDFKSIAPQCTKVSLLLKSETFSSKLYLQQVSTPNNAVTIKIQSTSKLPAQGRPILIVVNCQIIQYYIFFSFSFINQINEQPKEILGNQQVLKSNRLKL